MLALSIARFDRIEEDELMTMGINSSWKNYEAYEHPMFIDRRVGFDVMKFHGEYYKIPYTKKGKQFDTKGDEILSICADCFGDRFYDENQDTYYCPRCDE
jgi:hypothetical protein